MSALKTSPRMAKTNYKFSSGLLNKSQNFLDSHRLKLFNCKRSLVIILLPAILL